MMSLIALVLFGCALAMVVAVLAGTLAPALPRIVALVDEARAANGARRFASATAFPRPLPRSAPAAFAR